MKPKALLPTWAPRVKPYLVRKLYELDAQGIRDGELLDQVGWALYQRCESFIAALEAGQGRAICPSCGNVVLHNRRSMALLHCTGCGWECLWRDYNGTIHHQQLNGGPEVVAIFQGFCDRFPKAKEYPEKKLLVDTLIHGFHHFVTSGRTRRPVGVNLIDADVNFVVEFLDRLAYGPANTPGLAQNQAAWRQKTNSAFRRQTRKATGKPDEM